MVLWKIGWLYSIHGCFCNLCFFCVSFFLPLNWSFILHCSFSVTSDSSLPRHSNEEAVGRREPFLLFSHIHWPDSVREDSHLLPLPLYFSTNRGDYRLCLASADLICKDGHPDDGCGGLIYSRQDPFLSYGREELDSDLCCPADSSNSTSATPPRFTLRPLPQESHLSWSCPWLNVSLSCSGC